MALNHERRVLDLRGYDAPGRGIVSFDGRISDIVWVVEGHVIEDGGVRDMGGDTSGHQGKDERA
jgi:hypothetical protein